MTFVAEDLHGVPFFVFEFMFSIYSTQLRHGLGRDLGLYDLQATGLGPIWYRSIHSHQRERVQCPQPPVDSCQEIAWANSIIRERHE